MQQPMPERSELNSEQSSVPDSENQFKPGTREIRRHYLRIALLLAGLAGFWACEDFLVQGAVFDVSPSYHHPFMYPCIRFGLDFLFAMAALLALNRFVLAGAIVVDFLMSAIVLAYGRYFHEPLALLAMRAAKEGVPVAGVAIRIIPPTLWILLMGALMLKLLGVFRLPPLPAWLRRSGATVCMASVAFVIGVLQFSSFNLKSVSSYRGPAIVYAYGYPVTWLAQSLLGPDMSDIANNIRQLRKATPDSLETTEPFWPVGDKIVIVQLESLGWNVLNAKMNGQELTPFFNSLERSSRVFRIHSYHNRGSADMDFAVLSGGPPDPRVINYTVPGLEYPDSLPEFMDRHGFHTAAFHGNSGGFFDRLPAFRQMKFDEIWFKENFRDSTAKRSSWGIRDSEIFRLSSSKLRKSTSPQFHFIITLDSHTPWNLINDDEKRIFPHSGDWRENYFNSIRVLDDSVRDYIQSLPVGTLIILYGDHTSGVDYAGFHSALERGAEYVPCFVHVCGNTAWLPVDNAPVISSPDLRVLDIVNFLRQEIEKSGRDKKLTPLTDNKAISTR